MLKSQCYNVNHLGEKVEISNQVFINCDERG
jgi:hypothetical protein